MRKIRHILEYLFLRVTLFFFGLLPYETSHFLCGKIIGGFTYLIGGRYRQMMHGFLSHGFPEFSEEKKQTIIRTAFQNLGHLGVEFVHIRKIRHGWMERYVEWDPAAVRAIQNGIDQKRGLIILSAHLGCWELICALITAKFGIVVNQIVGAQGNSYADVFVNQIRGDDHRVHPIYTGGSNRSVLKALKNFETVGLAADQNARHRGIFVSFMNRPASTHIGPAKMALASGAETIFVIAVRQPRGHFRMEAVALGRIENNDESTKEQNIAEFTLRWVACLEEFIQKYPEQYFWLHNRWKTAPGPGDVVHKL